MPRRKKKNGSGLSFVEGILQGHQEENHQFGGGGPRKRHPIEALECTGKVRAAMKLISSSLLSRLVRQQPASAWPEERFNNFRTNSTCGTPKGDSSPNNAFVGLHVDLQSSLPGLPATLMRASPRLDQLGSFDLHCAHPGARVPSCISLSVCFCVYVSNLNYLATRTISWQSTPDLSFLVPYFDVVLSLFSFLFLRELFPHNKCMASNCITLGCPFSITPEKKKSNE